MRNLGRTNLWRGAIALLIALNATTCKDGNTVTGLASSAPGQPGLAGDATIAGTWNGYFDTDDPADCHAHVWAKLVLTQSGTDVRGTLMADPNSCGVAGEVVARYANGNLEGGVLKDGWSGGGLAGRVEGSTLTARLHDIIKPSPTDPGARDVIPGGSLRLTR